MHDPYKLFGFSAIILSLFFIVFVAEGTGKILFAGGIAYGLVFIFHLRLDRLVDEKVKGPLFAYGGAVVANGLIMEVLAYLSNLDKTAHGQKAALFSQQSLLADLAMGLPFYLVLAAAFLMAVIRFNIEPR
jgi:hypothetical protein